MKRSRGFTLIELLVVMAIVSALLSIVVPRYIHKVDVAKEAALRENLGALRIALDQYYSDKGVYPEKLTDLVVQRYLRAMPLDPVTDQRDSWLPMIREEDRRQEGGVRRAQRRGRQCYRWNAIQILVGAQ